MNVRFHRVFVKKYGVPYPYLIAGAPTEMWEKVPQAVNLNTWPATFFVGKDGRVKLIHAGFAAPASGDKMSTPGSVESCAATNSLATRFMPSRAGVTNATCAARRYPMIAACGIFLLR